MVSPEAVSPGSNVPMTVPGKAESNSLKDNATDGAVVVGCSVEGAGDGTGVGAEDGTIDGVAEGSGDGTFVGDGEGTIEGTAVGHSDGVAVVGNSVGLGDGALVGSRVSKKTV